jgi:two-component system response regulator
VTPPPILLVEDNPDDLELTQLALREAKLVNRLVVARDGVEALDLLLRDGGDGVPLRPIVVLLDLKLPRVDGLQVLERIRADARTRELPVVVLTSSDEDEDRHRSYALHVNSYVRKPVDFERFQAAVRHLGFYWTVLNEPPPLHGR